MAELVGLRLSFFPASQRTLLPTQKSQPRGRPLFDSRARSIYNIERSIHYLENHNKMPPECIRREKEKKKRTRTKPLLKFSASLRLSPLRLCPRPNASCSKELHPIGLRSKVFSFSSSSFTSLPCILLLLLIISLTFYTLT